jgi:hypothetical protein
VLVFVIRFARVDICSFVFPTCAAIPMHFVRAQDSLHSLYYTFLIFARGSVGRLKVLNESIKEMIIAYYAGSDESVLKNLHRKLADYFESSSDLAYVNLFACARILISVVAELSSIPTSFFVSRTARVLVCRMP